MHPPSGLPKKLQPLTLLGAEGKGGHLLGQSGDLVFTLSPLLGRSITMIACQLVGDRDGKNSHHSYSRIGAGRGRGISMLK
jgi:hypothetical protein